MDQYTDVPIFNEQQEQRLRAYFLRLDHRLGIERRIPDRQLVAFSAKLGQLSKKSSKFALNGKALIAGMVSAFSIGILFSQIALMPTTIATRGYAVESGEAILNPPQVLSLKVSSPKDVAFQIMNTSLDADVEASLTRSNSRIQIILHSLRANAHDQTALKNMLNLNQDASGDYTVVISPLR